MQEREKDRSQKQFVSRAGAKLQAALNAFAIDPTGMLCADLGCNAGGFTDCLLQNGATKVYAVDTGYGALEWKLRKDERVVVMERTNALHVSLPEAIDLVVIDLGWTRQHHILPVARTLLNPSGRIISLIKPHYEADRSQLQNGVLPKQDLATVLEEVFARLTPIGFVPDRTVRSPIEGRKGNEEHLALFLPATRTQPEP